MSEEMIKTDSEVVRILGIESSCDETAASIVENGRRVLSNVVASQIEIHKKYGGVFPRSCFAPACRNDLHNYSGSHAAGPSFL